MIFQIYMLVYFTAMGEICYQLFIDKISPVKINSTVWLNPNQIVLSCKGNKICLYNCWDGKLLSIYMYYIKFLIDVLSILYSFIYAYRISFTSG